MSSYSPAGSFDAEPLQSSLDSEAFGFGTLAIHGGGGPDGWCGASVTPIVQSTSFVQKGLGGHLGHAYSRVSNPTVDALEKALGKLEGTPQAVAFSTGLAAETAIFLSLLTAGDHVVLGEAIYGGTVRLAQRVLSGLGIASDFVDTSNAENVRAALRPRTRLVFIESPANPTLRLTDISAIAAITKSAGVPLVVDNTFLTAVIQRPLDLGADISVYSTTKHIDGHSVALGGAVTSRDEQFLERLRFIRKCTGAIQTPFGAWLTSRGLASLPVRLREHSRSALAIAAWLQKQPGVLRVNYPGLDDFPQRELAAKQHGEFHGGVLSFELEGGIERAKAFLLAAKLCVLAEHVGSIESVLTHSATMTHADVPAAQRQRVGISDGLVRLSVGLEDVKDIQADLAQAIAASAKFSGGRPAAEGLVESQAAGAALVEAKLKEGGALCASR